MPIWGPDSMPIDSLKGGKQTAAGAAWRLSKVAEVAIASEQRRVSIWGVGNGREEGGVAAGESMAFSSGVAVLWT